MLPKDRDVIVYLGYDLLNLQRYDELLKLTSQYSDVLSKEPDLPLFAGYVHKHNGQLEEARADFTKALERDPEVVTAYVNRGYVLHDLGSRSPQQQTSRRRSNAIRRMVKVTWAWHMPISICTGRS